MKIEKEGTRKYSCEKRELHYRSYKQSVPRNYNTRRQVAGVAAESGPLRQFVHSADKEIDICHISHRYIPEEKSPAASLWRATSARVHPSLDRGEAVEIRSLPRLIILTGAGLPTGHNRCIDPIHRSLTYTRSPACPPVPISTYMVRGYVDSVRGYVDSVSSHRAVIGDSRLPGVR